MSDRGRNPNGADAVLSVYDEGGGGLESPNRNDEPGMVGSGVAAPIKTVRRIVTGRTADGREVFVEDEKVQPLSVALLAGLENFPLWSANEVPPAPNDGKVPGCHPFFPGPGGVRFFIFTIAPAAAADAPEDPTEADFEEAERVFPGLLAANTAHEVPGMHATTTIDLGILLAGEAVLELESGEERTIRAGDVVVQNGTWHRWHNRGDVPASFAFVVIGTTDAR